jgi:hypothetical protein
MIGEEKLALLDLIMALCLLATIEVLVVAALYLIVTIVAPAVAALCPLATTAPMVVALCPLATTVPVVAVYCYLQKDLCPLRLDRARSALPDLKKAYPPSAVAQEPADPVS